MAIRKELVDAKCNTGQTHTFQTPAFFTFKLFYNPDILQTSDDSESPAETQEVIFRKYVEPNEDGTLPPVDESQKQIIVPLDKSLHEQMATDEKTGEKVIEYVLTRVSRNHFVLAVPTGILKEYFDKEEFSILYDPKIDKLPVYIYHKLDSVDPYGGIEDLMPKAKLKEPYYAEDEEGSDTGGSDQESSDEENSEQESSEQESTASENDSQDNN